MSDISVNPYLFFRGDAEQAMEFYQGVFGGKLDKVPYEQMGGNAPESLKDKLMHAYLSGGDIILMASDTEQASEKSAKISISLGGEDEGKLTKIFNSLGEGGTIDNPLKKEMWGDTFGSLTDKFGIEWMVNISSAK